LRKANLPLSVRDEVHAIRRQNTGQRAAVVIGHPGLQPELYTAADPGGPGDVQPETRVLDKRTVEDGEFRIRENKIICKDDSNW